MAPGNKDRDGKECKNCEDEGAVSDVDTIGNLSEWIALPIALCLLGHTMIQIHNNVLWD